MKSNMLQLSSGIRRLIQICATSTSCYNLRNLGPIMYRWTFGRLHTDNISNRLQVFSGRLTKLSRYRLLLARSFLGHRPRQWGDRSCAESTEAHIMKSVVSARRRPGHTLRQLSMESALVYSNDTCLRPKPKPASV